MTDYKVEVKAWMLKQSTEDFTFMKDRNNDNPMPLLIMYGTKIGEAPKMVKMQLHGDIRQRIITRCMCCGRPITNKVSQYFGIGPICGEHNYVNPFATEEELDKAVAAYRDKLVNTTWTGWIPLSALVSVDDSTDVSDKVEEMPFEVTEDSEYLFEDKTETFRPQRYHEINARIGKPIKGTDDLSVFLSFRYSERVKEAVKNLRVHIWNTDTKEWEIEYKELADLQEALPTYSFNITGTELLPKKVDSTSFEYKTEPMPHQLTGVQYGLDHRRWLLADQQGVGKTKQIIDLAVIRKQTDNFKHCLIVCGVNSLKWNWMEKIEKHSNEQGHILGMYTKKRSGKLAVGGNAEKLADIDKLLKGDPELASKYFIITNVESLRNTEIAEKLAELCEKEIINLVAIDEIHRCKNLTTQQGKGMLQLQPDYRIGMTGTPLINTPLDLFAILKWLGYQRYGFRSFKEHFCYTDDWGGIVGYKNIDQLEGQLDSIMLRRLKSEVLPDLPEKVYVNEYVELTDEQKSLYNQVIDNVIHDEDLGAKISTECQLAVKMRLRQVSGGIGPFNFIKKNPKLDRLEQIVEEAVYSGTKVIVYSNWVECIKPASERLARYNPMVITGKVNDVERQAMVNRFQNDDSVKVILGTIDAMGTGLTLTAATEVVFIDEPWTDAIKEQACDRAHRIGTKSNVTIHTIMSYGTYDEEVHDIVLGKKSLSAAIVDKDELAKLKIA